MARQAWTAGIRRAWVWLDRANRGKAGKVSQGSWVAMTTDMDWQAWLAKDWPAPNWPDWAGALWWAWA